MTKLRFFLFVALFAAIFTSSCKKENEDVFSGCLRKTYQRGNVREVYEYNSKGQRISSATFNNALKSSESFYTYNSDGLQETITTKVYKSNTQEVLQESFLKYEYSGKNLVRTSNVFKDKNGVIIFEEYLVYENDSYNNVIKYADYVKKDGSWVESGSSTINYTYSSSGKILTKKEGNRLETNKYNAEDKLIFSEIIDKEYNYSSQKNEDTKTEFNFYDKVGSRIKKYIKSNDVYLLENDTEIIYSYSGEQLMSTLSKTTSYRNGNVISPTPVRNSESTTTYTYECR